MKLDGLWDFILDTADIGEKEKWNESFPEKSEKIVVPSCWNNELGKYDYEGKAWYRTKFFHTGGDLILRFNAVSTFARVYVDGVFLKEHFGAFTAFDVKIKDFDAGEHEVVVMVHALYNSCDTIPLSVVDWYHYGGITRSVEVFSKKGFYTEGMKISYTLNDSLTEADVALKITAVGQSDTYKLYINGNYVNDYTLSGGENEIKLHLSDICLWDTENPKLYTFKLESENDLLCERTGFRKISINGYKFMLNNKPFKIKGINRHEEHPDWGFSVPLKLMKKDVDILLDMNVNCVRGSHYPNSKEFLNYLDEVGILFWSEIPMWQIREQMANPVLISRAEEMTKEMLEQYYNHPSIIIWGLHNECDTNTKAGYELTKRLHKIVKDNGGNRLVTFASYKPFDDLCFEFCDFISLNSYVGWYYNTLDGWDEYFKKFNERIKSLGLYHLPLVMSEFGTAAIYGECSFEEQKWSENYQSIYMKKSIEKFYEYENMAGTFVWQFADIRVCREKVMDRARGFNNKGVVNEYRKPKMAYYTVKEIYSE